MWETIKQRLRRGAPGAGFWSARMVRERVETISVRKGVLQPVALLEDAGAMCFVSKEGAAGYGATCDLSEAGLAEAFKEAAFWAQASEGASLIDHRMISPTGTGGGYRSQVQIPWSSVSLSEKVDLLSELSGRLGGGHEIVDWDASLSFREMEVSALTSAGGEVSQQFCFAAPHMGVTAHAGADSQRRTFGGGSRCRQGGWEAFSAEEMLEAAPRVAEEARELLSAPNCPEGPADLLLAPDQMVLQIHESIGHPLELDRILGDERNYAGTSFVTPEMFGSYRYGSELLNVTFAPDVAGQMASYAFDDEGAPAVRHHLIERGILKRGLGGASSQARSHLPGVACARAVGWNRPPIDRMANLNVEPGDSSFDEMVASIERGVFMKTNCSWSIDDSRLKFQFGCEWARLIEEGELAGVVKNPNYRGVTPAFWRGLKMVGGEETFEVMGTPNCGKGEPNQMIHVGHASPVCLFEGVDIFGGA